MARQFTTSGDVALFSAASVTRSNGVTLAAVIRPSSLSTNVYPLQVGNGGAAAIRIEATTTLTARFGATANPTSNMPVPTNAWSLVAVTRPAGSTVTPRCHLYVYSTNTWTHLNCSSTVTATSAATGGRMGHDSIFNVQYDGQIAAGAVWNRELTDAQLENLPYTLTAWRSLSPLNLWLLDQASTGQAIVDQMGVANQSSLTGTSIGTSSVPIGYGLPVIRVSRTAPPALTADATFPAVGALSAIAATSAPQYLFTNQVPTAGHADGTPGITTATSEVFAKDGYSTGIRFYASDTISGTYTVALWQVTGEDNPGPGAGDPLATKVMPVPPTPDAWNVVPFDDPVPVTANTLYRAGMHNSDGRYVATTSFFTGPLVNGNITAPQNGDDPTGLGSLLQGTYEINAALAYPDNAFSASCYFVEAEFREVLPGGGQVDGDATLTAAGGLTAVGTRDAVTTATLAGTGGLSGTGVIATSATANLSAAGALTAAGVLAKVATTALAATGTLNAAAERIQTATAALNGTAALTGTGTLSMAATVTLAASGGLSAVGDVTGLNPTVEFPATAALTSAASRTAVDVVQLSAVGTLAGTAARATAAALTLAGVGALTATAVVTTPGLVGSAPTDTLATITRPTVLGTITRPRWLSTGRPPRTT
ncbi:DUF4082 domain-containing protein [Actinoplanes sp. NPDC051861]|uniref:DUF4082 domain-containing protein n=1 Tax=Actinoplanes sp. NPDC051861 TaxID=3155170 RepID=UPI00341BA85D